MERLQFLLAPWGAMVRWLCSWWSATGSLWLIGMLGELWQAHRGLRRLPRLAEMPEAEGLADEELPVLSVIVAARNEESGVERAMRSLLAAAYPRMEIVAVDDRSTDRTGAILDDIARCDPRLRVIHVTDLPAGWLGKNHAIQLGATASTGEWLLFTDADVRFSPTVLRRAVSFAVRRGFDHVTAAPALQVRGLWLRLFVAEFSLAVTLWQRPWHAARPNHRATVGVGAFNLVRRSAVNSVGGYSALPLAVADDVALGRVLKAAGCRQTLLVAGGLDRTATHEPRPFLQLQWYPDLRAAVRGLEKNAFAMFDFRVPLVAFWGVVGVIIALGPLAALLLAPGWHRLPWLISMLLACVTFGAAGREMTGRFPWPLPLFYPVAQLILAWTLARSTWVTLNQGGVSWRDTFYPLSELRSAHIGPLRQR